MSVGVCVCVLPKYVESYFVIFFFVARNIWSVGTGEKVKVVSHSPLLASPEALAALPAPPPLKLCSMFICIGG